MFPRPWLDDPFYSPVILSSEEIVDEEDWEHVEKVCHYCRNTNSKKWFIHNRAVNGLAGNFVVSCDVCNGVGTSSCK